MIFIKTTHGMINADMIVRVYRLDIGKPVTIGYQVGSEMRTAECVATELAKLGLEPRDFD